jgi:hypothetical protein
MGRLIPAGTGLPAYKRLWIVLDEKAPTYAPPAPARIVQPELAAGRRRVEPSLFGVMALSGAGASVLAPFAISTSKRRCRGLLRSSPRAPVLWRCWAARRGCAVQGPARSGSSARSATSAGAEGHSRG